MQSSNRMGKSKDVIFSFNKYHEGYHLTRAYIGVIHTYAPLQTTN